ncbi:MAG TPA: DUF192 domain-containing protein [Bryobacteraceae bacterium]|nr:DUF192 domain-containing protein [Bryobacteraceae bacterium]
MLKDSDESPWGGRKPALGASPANGPDLFDEAAIQDTKSMLLAVRNETRDTILGHAIRIADRASTRRKGLLGRSKLDPGEGLWIVPCQGIHTWGMKFPIDVLYLDRKKTVRKLRRALRPWRVSICLWAHSVLELPAGMLDRTGTVKGDRLSW